MHGQPKQRIVIIIGGGPAGLTAGLYASRAKLKSLIIEKKLAGGQIATTEHVENYPGYISGTGQELTEIMQEQAKKFGAELLTANVTSVELTGRDKIITTTQT